MQPYLPHSYYQSHHYSEHISEHLQYLLDQFNGKGTFFNHAGFGILINAKATIGNDCKIGNNVSIIGQGPYKNPPILKNHIFVGPGAIIQGPVIVEDNVIVAPNAVVPKSVPKNAIVAGIPAKIIGWSDQLEYDIFKDESWKEGTQPYLQS